MVDTAWVALSLLPKIGTKTLAVLMDTFGDAASAIQADTESLTAIRGIGNKTAEAIRAIDLPDITRQIDLWQKRGVTIRPSYYATYPRMLSSLNDAPPTLFIRGNINPHMQAVAIVGTRNPSNEARRSAFKLGQMLATQGWVIVSGLALGIDSAAHEGALSANGKTIAVLGSGVLNIYPEVNKPLAQRILEHGALIGENHPNATPKPARLVSRNRIISGLSQHVIVVETAIDGGAMYAARFATEQGRTLYAMLLSESGNLELLKNKAKPISLDLRDFSLKTE